MGRDATLNTFVDNTEVIQAESLKARDKGHKIALANIVHDFRTPLNTIKSNLDQLQEDLEVGNTEKRKLKIIDS